MRKVAQGPREAGRLMHEERTKPEQFGRSQFDPLQTRWVTVRPYPTIEKRDNVLILLELHQRDAALTC